MQKKIQKKLKKVLTRGERCGNIIERLMRAAGDGSKREISAADLEN